ncbi:UDP-glucose 4-epimerase [Marinithermofilum abyssi]|uniref:UDP-glucose 4-epimerase n=1 Tax=Marinithermofilum abyssi TaxID=1571185 RepID=A0A8J2VF41_9BACL|nr:SDR family oxidoreductase [Marinithermofilum abyssi]GGE04951.1 UDP-glucose 4-epimerase [Marinithermofilum abyssi]
MKVLVTGGAGFIGSHIVDKLIARGDDVVIVDNLSTGDESYIHPEASFYRMNIEDERILEVFERERPQAVIHQAAQSAVPVSVEDPIRDAQINIQGTIRVLEGCRRYGVEKVVYASSAAVYGNPEYLPIDEKHPVRPLSPYGISKYTPEHYLHAYHELYGLRYTIFRYANVYGIRQVAKGEGAVISIFIDRLLKGEDLIIFGDGEQTRDYIYVDDVANANVAALSQADGEVLNLGTGKSTSLNDLVKTLQAVSGKEIQPVYGEERPGDIKYSYFDNRRALERLDWTPAVGLETGLKQTYEYYKECMGR